MPVTMTRPLTAARTSSAAVNRPSSAAESALMPSASSFSTRDADTRSISAAAFCILTFEELRVSILIAGLGARWVVRLPRLVRLSCRISRLDYAAIRSKRKHGIPACRRDQLCENISCSSHPARSSSARVGRKSNAACARCMRPSRISISSSLARRSCRYSTSLAA